MAYRTAALVLALTAAGMVQAATTQASVLGDAMRAGRAVPYRNGLALVLNNGQHVRMTDDTRGCSADDQGGDDGHCYRYSLVRDLPEQHAFIVREAYSAGESLLLIDDRTGRQTALDGMPVFSPDGTRFLVNDDDAADTHDDNLEVWRRDGDVAVLEWAHATKQAQVEAPALTAAYHVRVTGWSPSNVITLAFTDRGETWAGQLTHGAKGWVLGADWPKAQTAKTH